MENWQELITINPNIRFGKPTIKGTRIAVRDILGWLASGMTEIEIINDFPQLTSEQVRAALMFAQRRDEITQVFIPK
jgi:uncharacterized protein (DUF433 family)